MRSLCATVMLVVLASNALAIDPGSAFDDPETQARYEKLIDEIRCLKCQNQTIKDSNAFLASDLRLKIQEMIAEGKSDAEIKDFLVARYGEFALYRPRASGKTLFLWIAPGVLLVGGGLILFRIVKRRMLLPIDDESTGEV